jgi:alcohol dehydrogenase
MRGVLVTAFGETPRLVDVPETSCPPDGVVIRVGATGLCRSDWHGWMGHDPDIHLPHVPGHELAGTITSVGADVRGWSAGQRVTVPFVCACGRCEPCLAGEGQVCAAQFQPGFTHWGSFADLVAIERAEANLVQLPDGLAFVTAASLGCRFATAYRALLQVGRLRGGEWLAVFGCGGVGLSAVMIGAAQGARVVAVDVSPEARAAAVRLGASAAIEPGGVVAAAVRDVTGGGAHVSVDALGSASTAVASVECLRTRGRHVQVGLLTGAASRPGIPMDRVIARELAVLGSHGMAAHEYPAMLARISAGELRPDLLVGRTIGLEEAPAALAAMDGPQPVAGMTVIVP